MSKDLLAYPILEVEDLKQLIPPEEWTETFIEKRDEANFLLVDLAALIPEGSGWHVQMNPSAIRAALKEADVLRHPRKWDVEPIYPAGRSPLTDAIESRRADDRMANVIVTARDSHTGTGKSTLAVRLAKEWDENGLSKRKCTLDPETYQKRYQEVAPGSVLVLDEAEQAADNRRSMSDQNVTLSHLWATMRFKEVSSILTLPTLTMLDKRLKELADYRIHVVRRGLAKVYEVKIEDTGEHQLFEKRMAWVKWDAMDDDPVYQALSEKKANRMDGYTVGDDDGDDGRSEKEVRDDLIRAMNEHGLSHAEIGEIVDLSRSAVTQIVNE